MPAITIMNVIAKLELRHNCLWRLPALPTVINSKAFAGTDAEIECASTLGATAIRVLCFVAPDQAATPPQHQVRIIVIVTTSFYDEELNQCVVHDGDACDRHHWHD